jgi:transcriptional regulator with XRE-family HTH domain
MSRQKPTLTELFELALANHTRISHIAREAGVSRQIVADWANPAEDAIPSAEQVPGLARALKRPEKEVAAARIRALIAREGARHERLLRRLHQELEALER